MRGRDIKRYSYDFADLWLINIHNGIKAKEIKPVNIDNYPVIKNYLDNFYPQLIKRADKGDSPYNLRNCAYVDDFYKPKLLWAETMRVHKQSKNKFPRFGYDSTGNYLTDKTCFFATGENISYLAAILNSSIGKYLCYQYVSILDDGGFLMQKVYLEKIPIPKFNIEIYNKINHLLNNPMDIDNIEIDINNIVYNLYDLTPEEIAFIEIQ